MKMIFGLMAIATLGMGQLHAEEAKAGGQVANAKANCTSDDSKRAPEGPTQPAGAACGGTGQAPCAQPANTGTKQL